MVIIVGGDIEDWGFIPSFLDENDERSAVEQFKEHYIGGWNSFKDKFKFDPEKFTLKYPGDPIMTAKSALMFRDELLLIFPSAWVLVQQKDGSWDVARMD